MSEHPGGSGGGGGGREGGGEGGGGGVYPLTKNRLQKDSTFFPSKSSKMLLIFDLKTTSPVVPLAHCKSASLSASKVYEESP